MGFLFSVPVRIASKMYSRIIGALLASFCYLSGLAQDANQENIVQDSSKILDEIVVTANRFPQKQNQTGKVLTIITKEMLERNAGKSTAEILNQFAGLNLVGTYNTPGSNIEIYTRGANVGNTLILIDGIPIFDVSSITTAFDINHYTTDQLDRIEILKGGQSTVYGSDAVAGVINLITNKKTSKPLQGNISLSAGSFGTFNGTAGISGSNKNNKLHLQYQRLQSKGLSSAIDTLGGSGFDRDGFSQNVFNASYEHSFHSNLSWHMNAQLSSYETDIDANAFNDDKDNKVYSKNKLIGTGFTYKNGNTAWHLNYSFNQTFRKYVDDSTSRGGYYLYSFTEFEGISHYAELFGKIPINKNWSIVTGLDSRFQETEQDYLFLDDYGSYEGSMKKDTSKISIYSAYASLFFSNGSGLQMEGGLRWNKHSKYGNNFTYSLNPSFVKGQWKFFSNISTAFKAPSLYQLYDAFSGMPTLKPEQSTIFELGSQVQILNKTITSRLTGFMRNSINGIDYSFINYRYFNNNRVWDRGIEWESSFRKGKWDATFNYTFLTGKVKTIKYANVGLDYVKAGDTTYNYQFRRPRNAANISIGFKANEKLYFSLQGRMIGMRREAVYMSDPIALKAYQVYNLYGEYILRKIRIYADFKNIFNADYIDAYGFTTRPRNITAGVRIII